MTDDDFATIREELTSFHARVRWLIAQVPEGRVATYGQIALYAGKPRAARAVGNILRDHVGPHLPWQRIINASGRISFRGDVLRADLQRNLLEAEGVNFSRSGVCSLETWRWDPACSFWVDDDEP